MANIKSAKKRILQDIRKTLRNKIAKSQTQTAIKKYEKLSSQDKNEAQQLLKKAHVLLDKAARKGVYHRNKSARIKSRLHKHFVKTYAEKTQAPKPNEATSNEATSSETIQSTEDTTQNNNTETT